MASALDVAQFILEKRGPMTTMKLQKLIYYAQVWSIVWHNDAIFSEPIEAWESGPVVRRLWAVTRGSAHLQHVPGGSTRKLTQRQKTTVSRVLESYGDKDAESLSNLTHAELPWNEAYALERSTQISIESISDYYSGL